MKITVWFGLVLGALSATGKVFVTKPGQTANLKCGVQDYKSLEWRHGDEQIYSIFPKSPGPLRGKSEIVDRSQLRHTDLRIREVKEQDAGKFTCVVDGKSQEHILLVVSLSLRSSADLRQGTEATLECNVKGLNREPAVQWKRPDGSLLAKSQIAQLKSLTHSDEGTWSCTFSYAGETYSESIEIKVAEPLRTTLAPVPPKNTKDDPVPKPPKPPLGLSWWMWVVIGVGCVVVLLLTVFVVCLCKRIKRRKRISRKMKNGRQRPMPAQYCQCNRPTAAAKPQQGRRREKPSAPPLQPLLMG